MLYTSEINDSVLIQLIILFALNAANKPIKRKTLDKLVLETCIINFADYSIAMENLEILGYIHEISDENLYRITDDGIRTLGFFQEKIPLSVRDSIKESVAPVFLEEKRKNSIRTEIIPLNEIEFMSDCIISDNGKPLMNLQLYAGEREDAEKICRIFKRNSDVIYDEIMNIFKKITENQ